MMLALISCCSALPLSAAAQTAPPAKPKARAADVQALTPDVVKLRNGGLVRGTITEFIPGQYVVIMSLSAELKRFEASEFSYAGPAKDASGPAVPPPAASSKPPPERTAPSKPSAHRRGLKFEQADPTTAEPLTLYVHELPGESAKGGWIHADGYRPLCAAPCVPALQPGNYELGVGMGTGRPKPIDEIVNIQGNERLVGDYRSRAGVRAAGLIITIAASVASIIMSSSGDSNLLGPAIGTVVGGAIIGLPLCFVRPKASLAKYVPRQP